MAEERMNELDGTTVQEPQKIDAAAAEQRAAEDGAGGPGIAAGEEMSAQESENWRLRRDTAALARQRLQAANAVQTTGNVPESKTADSESGDENGAERKSESADGGLGEKSAADMPEAAAGAAERDGVESTALAEADKKLSRKERRQKEKEEAAAKKAEAERQKREAQEEKERLKREEQETKERLKREAQEEKEKQKRLVEEERQRKLHEKKEAKAVVRQERRAECKSLWHMAEFAMFVTFIVLAIDQTGVYGFLFVWLFIAVMVASIALLLLGVVRAVRKKRCGIIFFAAIVGVIVCTAWFIFLVSSQGLGLGPIPS